MASTPIISVKCCYVLLISVTLSSEVISSENQPIIQFASVGQNITLNCNTTKIESAQLNWFRKIATNPTDDLVIKNLDSGDVDHHNNNHSHFSYDSIYNSKTDEVLFPFHIINVRKGDTANYSCSSVPRRGGYVQILTKYDLRIVEECACVSNSSRMSDTDEELMICDFEGFLATGNYSVLIDANSRLIDGSAKNDKLQFELRTEEVAKFAKGFTFKLKEYTLSNVSCRFVYSSVPQVSKVDHERISSSAAISSFHAGTWSTEGQTSPSPLQTISVSSLTTDGSTVGTPHANPEEKSLVAVGIAIALVVTLLITVFILYKCYENKGKTKRDMKLSSKYKLEKHSTIRYQPAGQATFVELANDDPPDAGLVNNTLYESSDKTTDHSVLSPTGEDDNPQYFTLDETMSCRTDVVVHAPEQNAARITTGDSSPLSTNDQYESLDDVLSAVDDGINNQYESLDAYLSAGDGGIPNEYESLDIYLSQTGDGLPNELEDQDVSLATAASGIPDQYDRHEASSIVGPTGTTPTIERNAQLYFTLDVPLSPQTDSLSHTPSEHLVQVNTDDSLPY